MNNVELAKILVELVGGRENVKSVTHCMTRLRFILRDVEKAKGDEIKALDEVMGVVYKGGQYQLIIGPTVNHLYDEVIKLVPEDGTVNSEAEQPKTPVKKDWRYYGNAIMGSLAGCMTPLIPVLICMGMTKAINSILGPRLLGLLSTTDNLYVLFDFVSDAGLYFLPIYVGYTAAKKFGLNELIGMLLGAILIHPNLIALAGEGVDFTVYGIPAQLQNYSSSIIPIILTVWIASYIEKFFKKYTPDVLQVIGVPVGTLLVMLPLELCLFGPMGAFLGQYICEAIIGLYDIAGPLAVAVLSATFGLLVLTGMHTVLFTFLFVTFPMMGYDGFILPSMLLCSWAAGGVTIACAVKFKSAKKKQLTIGYFMTWLLGGVGEPTLYGLSIPYRTPLYASVIAGGLSGLLGGVLGLKAYVLSPSNGIYGLTGFIGGPTSNYVVLAISVVASVAIGFATMWFMKLDESLA